MVDKQIERIFIILKFDVVVRGFMGEIISCFEKCGFKIVGMKMIWIDRKFVEKYYVEYKGKFFFELFIDYIIKVLSVVMVVEGRYVISVVRKMVGVIDLKDVELGSIRGDYGFDVGDVIYNVIYVSDSLESVEREINFYFKFEEFFEYCKVVDWFYYIYVRLKKEYLDSMDCLEC